MFIKYLYENMRNKKVIYFSIIILETAMLVVAILANGIMIDNIAHQDWIGYYADKATVGFNENVNTHELYAGIVEFCKKSPIAIKSIQTIPCDTDTGKFNCSPMLIYYPTYSDLENEWKGHADGLPSEKQYDNNEKAVILGKAAGYDEYGEYIYTDEHHINIAGESFLVAGESHIGSYAILLFGSEPQDTECAFLDIELKNYPSQQKINEFTQLFYEVFAADREIKIFAPPQIRDLLDIRKSISSIVMTISVQIISAFNIMLIFKFMVDSRKKQFAVLRLCGFKKSVCIKYSFGEIMMISFTAVIISCVAVQLLKPALAKYYSVFEIMYDWGYLAVLSLVFLAAAALIFAVYIVPSLGKSVSRELREM